MKNRYWGLLVLNVLLIMLTGCANGISISEEMSKAEETSETEGASVLWVVTEQSTSDGMNYQAEAAAESFGEAHEGMTVRIDILPTDAEEREIYLKQLRTQIMAGKGPDVYLLPTGGVLTLDAPSRVSSMCGTTQMEVEPLFQDVTQAMYNGMFADISGCYDEDRALNTDALQIDVMEAGVIDGCRYVLPLRYTMPILLTDPSNYEETGISQELIDSGLSALVEYALETDDTMMATGLRMPDDMTLLTGLFDYEKGEMVITTREIADYMGLYQRWYAAEYAAAEQFTADHLEQLRIDLDEMFHHSIEDPLAATMTTVTLDSFNSIEDYADFFFHWSLEGFPLYADSLPGALEQAGMSSVLEKELEAHPLRSVDGKVTAEITYYGAVGSGCKDIALAYDFLRIFLTEAYQWDQIRPRNDLTNIDVFDLPKEVQADGFVEDSWPVRVKGSTPYLWNTLQYQLFAYGDGLYNMQQRRRPLRSKELVLTDADLPVLETAIDEVRFPVYQPYEETLRYALTLLNNEDGTPAEADIDALAEKVYQYLWWHLAEG